MDTRKIKKLIELVKETGIGELEVKSGEESVRISCNTATPISSMPVAPPPTIIAEPTPAVAQPTEPATPEGHTVAAPMVGTVYLAPTPGAKPFVAVGERVSVGDTLCLIEAMKMYNKIEADVSGVLSARLIDNQQPVEYDQPLFIIDTGE